MSLFLQQFVLLARRNPFAVGSIALIVVLLTADYFLWKKRDQLAVSFERTRQEGQTMLLSLNGQARIHTQNSMLEEALAYIGKNLAVESDLAGNLDYFYQIEKSAKIRLSNLSQLSSQPTSEEETYRAIPFSLRLSGAYPQILAFLHELETGPRLLRVKSYRFSQTDSAAVDGLSLDLTVEMLGRP